MDKKVKRKWVKALRSGRYKQGQGRLEIGDLNCCLGVLCRVMRAKNVGRGEFVWRGEHDWSALPETLRKDMGITTTQEDCLVTMNDGGKSFREIADYIEKRL